MNKRELGSKYEEMAVSYLLGLNYRILNRNYHAGKRGEIDIICLDPYDTLVFVEVKYRTGSAFGSGLEAINPAKQKTICRVALAYLKEKKLSMNLAMRFDAISFDGDSVPTHIMNAFPFVL